MVYWYKSLSQTFPKDCSLIVNLDLFEIERECEPKEIDTHKLIYLGIFGRQEGRSIYLKI